MSQPTPNRGAIWVPLILIGAILIAAVPMLVGVMLTALVPWFGHLSQTPLTALLHMLWMYPVLWAYCLIAEPVETFYVAAAKQRATQHKGLLKPGAGITLLSNLSACLVVTLMYSVLFTDTLGALVAALITFLLFKPIVRLLERETTKPQDPGAAQ